LGRPLAGAPPSAGPALRSWSKTTAKHASPYRHWTRDGGLVAKGGDLRGFEIAGEDGAWKPAQATIDGDKVIVTSSEVAAPTQARYAWSNFPDCNLFNGEGLPASPFRTAATK